MVMYDAATVPQPHLPSYSLHRSPSAIHVGAQVRELANVRVPGLPGWGEGIAMLSLSMDARYLWILAWSEEGWWPASHATRRFTLSLGLLLLGAGPTKTE